MTEPYLNRHILIRLFHWWDRQSHLVDQVVLGA